MEYEFIEQFNNKKAQYLDNYYKAIKLNQNEKANYWLEKIKEIDEEYKNKCGFDNYNKE